MKRHNMYKNFNRNRNNNKDRHSHYSLHTHSSSCSQTLTDDSEEPSGVRIVELNSAGNVKSPDKEELNIWDHVYPDVYSPKTAYYKNRRDRPPQSPTVEEISDSLNDFEKNFIYDCLNAEINNRHNNDKSIYNHQMDCFMFNDQYESESKIPDDYARAEAEIHEINRKQSDNENLWYDSMDDSLSTDDSQHKSQRTPTIVIYSFKKEANKSNSDFGLLQIQNPDPNASYIDFDDYDLVKETKSEYSRVSSETQSEYKRVPTPRPTYCIPRVLLPTSPNLPTLTEVSEPTRNSASNQTEISKSKIPTPSEKLKQRSVNNWFDDRSQTDLKDEVCKNSSYNIKGWLALSPRDIKNKLQRKTPLINNTQKYNVIGFSTKQNCNIVHPTTKEQDTNTSRVFEVNSKPSVKHVSEKATQTIILKEFRDKTTSPIANNPGIEYRYYDKIENYFRASPKEVDPKYDPKYLDVPETFDSVDSSNWVSERTCNSTRVIRRANAEESKMMQVSNKCPSDSVLTVRRAECAPVATNIPLLQLSGLDTGSSNSRTRFWLWRICKCFTCDK